MYAALTSKEQQTKEQKKPVFRLDMKHASAGSAHLYGPGAPWPGPARPGLARPAQARRGPARPGPDGTGPDRAGSDRLRPAQHEPDRTGPDRIGPHRPDWTGLVWKSGRPRLGSERA